MNSSSIPSAPRALHRMTATAALAALLIQLAGQALMQAGGTEPAFDAPALGVGRHGVRDAAALPVGHAIPAPNQRYQREVPR
jgi:hypothetical protein